MPPKGKKPSKAERERLKREEAERKAREEEEARLKAEQEEKERQERKRREAEERQRLENEEKKKRKGQLEELDSLWNGYYSTMKEQEDERRRNSKWDRYMRCDGSPDPAIEAEINTYINLYREDLISTDIEPILKESRLILELIDELQFILDDTPAEEVILREQKRNKSTIMELQNLLEDKLDLASHYLSLKATDLRNPETMNLQKTFKTDDITLCMWGNLSKNPRIKHFEFEDTGMSFDIPKLLTLSDIAIRVLVTKFDHFTRQTTSFYPKVKTPVVATPVQGAPAQDENTKKEDATEENENPTENAEAADPVSREETTDISKLLNKAAGDDEEEEETKEVVEEEPAEDDVKSNPDVFEYEDFDGYDDVVDMRANIIIGSVVHFNVLEMPPQPKTLKDMVITQKVDPPKMHFYPYIADEIPEGEGEKAEDEKPGQKKDDKQVKKDEKPPIALTLKIPDHIALFEEPQVCRWDYKTKEWKTTDFTDEKFNEDDRILSFKTNLFGTFGLLQDSHINLPYQSWEMRPRGTNHVHITMIAAIAELEFEIKDDKICVAEPIKLDAVESLQDKWMSLRDFRRVLSEHGINIFPREDAHKFVNITKKRGTSTEERMYQQMAMVASAMAFSWSDWNNKVEDPKTFIIQGCERIIDEPLLEEDLKLFMITKRRTKMLRMVESADEFSDDHEEGTEFHADLYHMSQQILSDEGKERVDNTNHLFVNTVYRFFKLTEAAVFS